MATTVGSGLALGLSGSAQANLVGDGGFTSFSGTAPGVGTSQQLAANTLSDWVNNIQIGGTPQRNGGVGFNFVYTPNAQGNYNYSGGDQTLFNTADGGLDSITQPPVSGGYTGDIIAADGAYRQGALSQTISGLTVGHSYDVSFYYAGAQETAHNGSTTEAFDVSLGSTTVKTPVLDNVSHGFTGWSEDTISFSATSTSEVLSFLAQGTPNGVPPISLLADVSMETATSAAPEPSSLVGGGLLVLVLALGAGIVRNFRKEKQA